MITETVKKICQNKAGMGCGEYLPLDNFSVDSRTKKPLPLCKKCRAKLNYKPENYNPDRAASYYQKNREALKERSLKRYHDRKNVVDKLEAV
jgi:hypothetical protein